MGENNESCGRSRVGDEERSSKHEPWTSGTWVHARGRTPCSISCHRHLQLCATRTTHAMFLRIKTTNAGVSGAARLARGGASRPLLCARGPSPLQGNWVHAFPIISPIPILVMCVFIALGGKHRQRCGRYYGPRAGAGPIRNGRARCSDAQTLRLFLSLSSARSSCF